MKHRLAYKYRFYPTDDQKDLLSKTFGCSRFVYNRMLAFRTDGWYKQQRIDYTATSSELTKTKKLPEFSWLNEVSCVPLQQSLRHLQSAFDQFFKKTASYPTFKKKSGKQSAKFTRSAFRFDSGTRQLWLAKMSAPLKIKWSRVLTFEPTTVNISCDSAGRYFVSFQGKTNIQPLPKNEQAVGIDMGLTHFAITSDKEFIKNPTHLKKHHARLKMLQQRLARRTKGGKNWQKTKMQITKLHTKIADSRRDFIHKFTTRMIQQYGHIITEDLAMRNMVKNHCIAEAINDAAWNEAFRQFAYKADWYERIYTQIDRFSPSSKRCNVCGYIFDHLDLSTRSWTCPTCDTIHHRDINAALNILAGGLSAIIYGQGVRLPKNFNSEAAASCVVTT